GQLGPLMYKVMAQIWTLFYYWPDKDRPPNFVLIMVDDLGIGDIGCYGNDTIRTPHIDRLASEGVRLTQHLAAAPLCTPSRAAFLTGRYALRSGLGSSGRVQVLLFLGGSGGLPPSETTFAKRLQQQGYTTGLVGKWHLGVSCESRGDHCHHPNHHGFSFFYGLPFTLFNDCVPGHGSDILNDLQTTLRSITLLLGLGLATLVAVRALGLLDISAGLLLSLLLLLLCSSSVWLLPFQLLARWNCVLMRDGQVVEQPLRVETLSQRLLQEAQGFVHRNKDRPFLLFFSLAHIHTPLFTNPQFMGKSRHGLYGDNLEEVDWIVGQITETVDSLGLSNSTLMYFTSDHGDTWRTGTRRGRREAGTGFIKVLNSDMLRHGGLGGGHQSPGIFRWPGRLPRAERCTSKNNNDFLPLDGHNLMPLLEGTAQRSGHEFMFHYCGVNLNAVRWHPPGSESIFKAHLFTPNFSPEGAVGCYRTGVCMCHGEHVTHHNPPLLYDLHHDPSESRPLTPELEPRYHEALREVDGPSGQLSWGQILWRPWLQPCCGTFPLCGCKEQSAQ
uniref:Arylsulfatase D n=1 Tax=Neogobius melanostomus TaxID=47308 RepID=A0A8C6S599_9GOBI